MENKALCETEVSLVFKVFRTLSAIFGIVPYWLVCLQVCMLCVLCDHMDEQSVGVLV